MKSIEKYLDNLLSRELAGNKFMVWIADRSNLIYLEEPIARLSGARQRYRDKSYSDSTILPR